jgi:D-alanyl-D-alanine carboxypeptidase
MENEALDALQAAIEPTGRKAASEAIEHRLEHTVMRKQEQVDYLLRGGYAPVILARVRGPSRRIPAIRGSVRTATVAAVVALAAALLAATPASAATRLERQISALVAAEGGPPGVIVTIRRGNRIRWLSSGRGATTLSRPPRFRDHMRLASVAKAFSAAVTLRLVGEGRLRLDDTVGRLRPDLPRAWHGVTVRRMLNHTSGVPNYTTSRAFAEHMQREPESYVPPQKVISWVADEPLDFPPGTRYRYSNTDNIVVALILERVTGRSYASLLRSRVFRPLRLRQTSFPTGTALPGPFIHGYAPGDDGSYQDISEAISPSGAWSSGAVVSTPRELNAFIRGNLGGRLFPRRLRRSQLRFVRGNSDPPGPGTNSAGLGIFSYRTKCGTMYGHTGSFPGYAQFAAASRHGTRSVTSSINVGEPFASDAVLARLRAMQRTLVCEALK